MSSVATKYAKAILDTDASLRRKAANGSRIRVSAAELATELQLTAGTASDILAYLSRVEAGGLTRVGKADGGSGGALYEFITPARYPDALAELKAQIRNPAEPAAKHPYLKTEVLEWLDVLKPGDAFTARGCANALEADASAVGAILLRFSRLNIIERLESATYRKWPKIEHEGNTIVVDTLSGLQDRVMEFAERDHRPSPLDVAAAVDRRNNVHVRCWTQINTSADNQPILQGPDGKFYKAVLV